MKVLLLADYYPPILGGMSRHAFLLANALRRRGYEVTVFTCGYKNVPERVEENGVVVVRFDGIFQRMPFLFENPKMKHHPPIQDYMIVRRLRSLIKTEQPDIVHSHGWILDSALPLKKTFNIPLIHTLHEYGLLCPKKTIVNKPRGICETPYTIKCFQCSRQTYGPIKALFSSFGVRLGRRMIDKVDKFIAVSSFVKQVHLRHLALTESDIVVIPNFYQKESIKDDASKNLPKNFILFVGVLFPGKGIDTLMNAYKQLRTKTKLVIMGNTIQPYKYQSTKNILIFENARRNLILQGYSRCKFLVVPSIYPETFGQVILEAMALRKAVIASNIGGIIDVVQDNITGLLVQLGNPKMLANAMDFLLNNPDVAENMGAKGYERFVTHFSEDKVLPMIERIYKEAISCLD